LAVGIDQADQGDRNIEQPTGGPYQAIESLFGRGIEQVQRSQRLQARLFVRRSFGRLHDRRRSTTPVVTTDPAG